MEVWINGISHGVFAHTGRIIVEGFAGNDDIEIAGSLRNAVEFRGGVGADRLKAGQARRCCWAATATTC